MPRRSILSATEREHLLTLFETTDELIRHYTFSETDPSIIRQHRGATSRSGFSDLATQATGSAQAKTRPGTPRMVEEVARSGATRRFGTRCPSKPTAAEQGRFRLLQTCNGG